METAKWLQTNPGYSARVKWAGFSNGVPCARVSLHEETGDKVFRTCPVGDIRDEKALAMILEDLKDELKESAHDRRTS